MRTIMTADSGRKYRSAMDCGAAVVGAGVTLGASMTLNAVSDDDCQYKSEPANVAKTLYVPGTSGLYAVANTPSASVVPYRSRK